MYKNQLQELAQRSCFNLPSYTSIREGPDHAPRFKVIVNFNGETFESPGFCTTLRQAEHLAAEVALNALASRGSSNSLAARILDETGVYKNLLQEVSQRIGALLPAYMTYRSGLGHLPVFTCTVELAGVTFTGEPAKNKKQAEKNAALAAWSSLKLLAQQSDSLASEKVINDEQEHVTVARCLQKFLVEAKTAKLPFPIKFPSQNPRPSSPQPSLTTSSKILPLICPKTAARSRPSIPSVNNVSSYSKSSVRSSYMAASSNDLPIFQRLQQNLNIGSSAFDYASQLIESLSVRPQKFPAAGAAPYIPLRHQRPHHGVAPAVTIRNAIPVFSAPPLPATGPNLARKPLQTGLAPPVCIRPVVPVFTSPPLRMDALLATKVVEKSQEVSKAAVLQMWEQPASKSPSVKVAEAMALRAGVQVDEPLVPEAPVITLKEQVKEPLLSASSAISLMQREGEENENDGKLQESTSMENLGEQKI